MHIRYFTFVYLEVVDAGGIVPHETCIEEKKFELIKKSCDRQIHKRNSLIELKESLQNMLTDAGISNYLFAFAPSGIISSKYFSFLLVHKKRH